MRRILIVSFFLLLVTLSFQNCSSEGDSTLVSNLPPPKTFDASSLEGVPFAFDTTMNEIAYMSCSHEDTGFNSGHLSFTQTYFVFKIGAYGSNSGIGLRREFKSYLTSNFGDSNQVVPESVVKPALVEAPQNAWPALVFAVRPLADPVSIVKMFHATEPKPIAGTDYSFMLANDFSTSVLTLGDNLTQILPLMNKPISTRLNYFTGQRVITRNLASEINYQKSADYNFTSARSLRAGFSDGQNSYLLTLNYTRTLKDTKNQVDPYISRRTYGPTDNGSSVWGRGYRPEFTQDPRVKGLGERNALGNIVEFDMGDNMKTVDTTWSCNTKYLIISPFDNDIAGNAFPSPEGASLPTFERCQDRDEVQENLSEAQKAERDLIYHYIPAVNWIVDPINKCIVPKTGNGDCYQKRQPDKDQNNTFIPIKYVKAPGESCGAGTGNACPEFLSICTRK